MQDHIVAKKYACALILAAQEKNVTAEVKEGLEELLLQLHDHEDLSRLFYYPAMTKEEKKKMLLEVFAGRLPEVLLNFLYVLIDERREKVLRDIYFSFRSLFEQKQGIVRAVLSSARPLTTEQRDRIVQKIGLQSGKPVVLEEKLDSTIIGGAVLKIGNLLYDGSVKSRIKALAKYMAQ